MERDQKHFASYLQIVNSKTVRLIYQFLNSQTENQLFRPMFITELLKGFLLEATYFDVCSANFEGRRTAV